jgi:hypothetical protein
MILPDPLKQSGPALDIGQTDHRIRVRISQGRREFRACVLSLVVFHAVEPAFSVGREFSVYRA